MIVSAAARTARSCGGVQTRHRRRPRRRVDARRGTRRVRIVGGSTRAARPEKRRRRARESSRAARREQRRHLAQRRREGRDARNRDRRASPRDGAHHAVPPLALVRRVQRPAAVPGEPLGRRGEEFLNQAHADAESDVRGFRGRAAAHARAGPRPGPGATLRAGLDTLHDAERVVPLARPTRGVGFATVAMAAAIQISRRRSSG